MTEEVCYISFDSSSRRYSGHSVALKGKRICSRLEEVHANPSRESEPQCENVSDSDIRNDAFCLIVLAWGDSVGDLIADVAFAKEVQPAMAIEGK
ncbi:Cation/calcium exchanger 5 [Acorus gramineus]|uniref:Cation/calcium exchanger 5 n=1 Tax=Acorus gramineus TaxID=55184 RepID=A0AAV9A0I5_ACOGR|nr:Cation/calcium exchanger 5 [Acorus gramineus]